MRTFLFTFVAIVSVGTARAADRPDCLGCERVQEIQRKFRELPSKRAQAPASLLQAGLNAVKGLKTDAQKRWTPGQIHEVVELLRVSFEKDFGGFILDGNTQVIRKNRQALEAEARLLPKAEADGVLEAIMLDQESDNSDYVEPKRK